MCINCQVVSEELGKTASRIYLGNIGPNRWGVDMELPLLVGCSTLQQSSQRSCENDALPSNPKDAYKLSCAMLGLLGQQCLKL